MQIRFDATGLTVQADGTFDLPIWLKINCATDERSSQNAAATVVTGFGVDAARMFSRDGVTRGLLVEPAGENHQGEQDITAWDAVGPPTFTAVTDPASGSGAWKAEDFDALAFEYTRDLDELGILTSVHTLSVWIGDVTSGQANIYASENGGIGGTTNIVVATVAGWAHYSDNYSGVAATTPCETVLVPASSGGAGDTGAASVWGIQVEDRAYPTSFIGSDNATFTRQSDKLRAAGAAISSDGFFRTTLKYRPHYAEDEAAGQHNLLWFDAGTKAYYDPSDQRIHLVIFGQDLRSNVLTFTRHTELLVTLEHTADSLRIVVSGAATGDGESTTTALPAFTVPEFAYILGSGTGSEEGADLLVLDAQNDWWPDLIVPNDDHEGAVSRYIWQWNNKENLDLLTQTYLTQCQDIEDAFFEIIFKRCLEEAEGVQLTILGKLVKQPRTTSDDGRFRSMIRARIAINLSHSTAEDVIKVASLLLLEFLETFSLRDEPPAQLRVTVKDPLRSTEPDLLQSLLNEADAGGVRLLLGYTSSVVEADKFTFSDHGGSVTTGKGLGDSNGGTTAIGYLASVED